MHMHTVSNLYFYVKNYKTKICTNHVLHKELFSKPVRKDFLTGKIPYKGRVKIMFVCLVHFCILIQRRYFVILKLQISHVDIYIYI